MHQDGVNWDGYSPVVHDRIIFDDCPDMSQFVLLHKVAFQAAGFADFCHPQTNCNLVTVDLAEKPVVVLPNSRPEGDHCILENFKIVEVLNKLC